MTVSYLEKAIVEAEILSDKCGFFRFQSSWWLAWVGSRHNF